MWQTIKWCFFKIQSIYFIFWSVPGLCCYIGFSLVAASRDCSLVVMFRCLIVEASLVVGYGLWSTGSVVVARGLRCSEAHEIFLDWGEPIALAGGFFTTEPPGKPPHGALRGKI